MLSEPFLKVYVLQFDPAGVARDFLPDSLLRGSRTNNLLPIFLGWRQLGQKNRHQRSRIPK